ncbi:MAG TPA: hypothetical protein VLH77_04450 [Gammaproteobacteria bacterium]|nr:hypothetical protein [Gammaproteobacteria bacterium]
MVGSIEIIEMSYNKKKLSSLLPGLKPFSFELEVEQKKKLESLCKKHSLLLAYPQGDSLNTLKALDQELETLKEIENKMEHNADKLLIKQYQLAIIRAFEDHLYQLSRENPPPQKPPESRFKRSCRRLGYGVLLTTGLILEGLSSIVGGHELIYFIPGIGPAIGIGLEITLSLLNVALYYYLENSEHKTAMGLDSTDKLSELLDLDREHISRATKINELMVNPASVRLNQESYACYAHFAETINTTIQIKKPKPKPFHKFMKYFLPVSSAVLMIINSSLIFAIPPLLSTPLGWGLVCVGALALLSYHLVLRGKAIVNSLNPSAQKFQEVKEQYEQFRPKIKKDFQRAYEKEMAYRENQNLLCRENRDFRRWKMAEASELIKETVKKKSFFYQNKLLPETKRESFDLELFLKSNLRFWKRPEPQTSEAAECKHDTLEPSLTEAVMASQGDSPLMTP